MKRIFPALFRKYGVRPDRALRPGAARRRCARWRRTDRRDPTIVLLTPGVYNSAYFEHAFLARQMGIELVEGRDLVVHDNIVYMRTTTGLQRVDVIYRRVDDDFLDPAGVPRRFGARRRRAVQRLSRRQRRARQRARHRRRRRQGDLRLRAARSSATTWIEDPILANVETYADDRATRSGNHVLEHLDELRREGGGRVGRLRHADRPAQHATRSARRCARGSWPTRATTSRSRRWRSRRAPCFIDGAIEPRHVDLRPYVLFGEKTTIVPGGLTRVALRKGSLVVNSSQGGGSKDTWVLQS